MSVLIVSTAPGAGTYVTLAEAVRDAQPDARILIRPVVYEGRILIDKPLKIIGDGPREKIIIENEGVSCILMQTDHVTVRGLTIRGLSDSSGKKNPGVDIQRGRLVLEDCDITSTRTTCVAISGSTAIPLIRNCKIHRGQQDGLLVMNSAGGTIENCDIFSHNGQGVKIIQGGNPTIRDCNIHNGKSAGVLIGQNGKGTLENCNIFGNAYMGIVIKEGGNPLIRGCSIRQGGQAGIFVTEDGKGTIESCDVSDNAHAGVYSTSGNLRVQQCRINRNRFQRIHVEKLGAGSVENCDLTANERGPWYIELGGQVRSSGNET